MTVNNYCTPADVRALLPNSGLTTAQDAILTTVCESASRTVDNFFNREPGEFYADGNPEETRYFKGNNEQRVYIGDWVSVSAVEVDESSTNNYTAWTLGTDYWTWPDNTLPIKGLQINNLNGNKIAFPKYPRSVKVTGVVGFSSTIPPAIKNASIAQAVRIYKRAQQAYADAGAVVDLGQLRYVQMLDPDIAALVSNAEYFRVSFA